ncbi:MAG: hypothetical protein KIS68_09605 [Bauldia sp.]|nr:hypothetical protein [Bauldia sp.]
MRLSWSCSDGAARRLPFVILARPRIKAAEPWRPIDVVPQQQKKEQQMGAILLWLLGIPIPIILLIFLLT